MHRGTAGIKLHSSHPVTMEPVLSWVNTKEILNPDVFLVLNLQWAILIDVYASDAFLYPSLRQFVLRQMEVYSLSAWSFYRVQGRVLLE